MRVNETKEKEITIRQDAEYWQTNGKTMKTTKTTATNIRHWEMESTVREESMKVGEIYNYHIYTLKPS